MLGLPVENYKGYVEADATQRARHIPSYSFFLMHGLAGNISITSTTTPPYNIKIQKIFSKILYTDITAPYLHGTQMARALTEAGVIFQYQVNIFVN